MEPMASDIEKAAGAIIDESGINALTIDTLRWQMRISTDKLLWHIESNDDILRFMAQRLEKEIQQLIGNLASTNHEPEKGLTELFKSLHDFFNLKPYFLDMMFADLFHVNGTSIASTLLKVREDIRSYLIQILNDGKKSGAFNPNMNASPVADSVIDNFRFFMSEIPYTHKMMQDLKRFRETRE